MPKSPEEMADAMISNYKEKTGKTLPQWIKIAKASGCIKHGEIVKHLKTEHGMTHGFANLVAIKTREGGGKPPAATDLVDGQYSGAKEALRPIYEALIKKVSRFGKDIEVSPKKTYVSLRRNKQFALIQPSTKTRVDVGINIKSEKPTARLEASGSFNSMVSHRVRLEKTSDVNGELVGWLKKAYESA